MDSLAGHSFGATHSFQNGQGVTGGIMDYGNGKIISANDGYAQPGEYAFNSIYNKGEVCRAIAASQQGSLWQYDGTLLPTTSCWGSVEPLCGNGVVDAETGEECDTGGASACCTSNCKWTAGSECASGEC